MCVHVTSHLLDPFLFVCILTFEGVKVQVLPHRETPLAPRVCVSPGCNAAPPEPRGPPADADDCCDVADDQDQPDQGERVRPGQHDEPEQPVPEVRELLQHHDGHQEGNLHPEPAPSAEGLLGGESAGESTFPHIHSQPAEFPDSW